MSRISRAFSGIPFLSAFAEGPCNRFTCTTFIYYEGEGKVYIEKTEGSLDRFAQANAGYEIKGHVWFVGGGLGSGLRAEDQNG